MTERGKTCAALAKQGTRSRGIVNLANSGIALPSLAQPFGRPVGCVGRTLGQRVSYNMLHVPRNHPPPLINTNPTFDDVSPLLVIYSSKVQPTM